MVETGPFFYFLVRKRFRTFLTPNPISGVLGCPNPILCPSNRGKTKVARGKLLIGDGRPSGVFHP